MAGQHETPTAGRAYAAVRHAAWQSRGSARGVSQGPAITGDERAPDPQPLREEPPESLRLAQAARLFATWKSPRGWRYWSDVNNSSVGVWYTAATFGFLLFGGALALLMRLQLAVPGNTFMEAETYN